MLSIRRRPLALGLATLLALPLAAVAPASAGTERYVAITSLPYTISNPGGYRLVGNLTCTLLGSNPAITIACDDVVLDLDGYSIVYVGYNGSTGPVNAVAASYRKNVTVRNGKLRGFWQGVAITGTSNMYSGVNNPGIVVEDLTVVESRNSAILLDGVYGAVVRRCNVSATRSTSGDAFGIRVKGRNAVVCDNVVMATTSGTGTAHAIYVSDCSNAIVERNTIANDDFPFAANTVGINAGYLGVVVGNRVAYMGTGITYGNSAGGPYRDNVVNYCQTSYAGGEDAGNNY